MENKLYEELSRHTKDIFEKGDLIRKFQKTFESDLNFLLKYDLVKDKWVKNNPYYIEKRPNFYESIRYGGLEKWINYINTKEEKEKELIKLQEDSLKSNIALNQETKKALKISKNVSIGALIVSILTFITLGIQVYQNINAENNTLQIEKIKSKVKLIENRFEKEALSNDSLSHKIESMLLPDTLQ